MAPLTVILPLLLFSCAKQPPEAAPTKAETEVDVVNVVPPLDPEATPMPTEIEDQDAAAPMPAPEEEEQPPMPQPGEEPQPPMPHK